MPSGITPIAQLPAVQLITLPTPWNVGTVQVYLIDSEPITLIDTGVRTDASLAALEFAFERLGRSLDEVERIILTHYHEDHLGLAQTIRRHAADLEVWAHVAEAEMIENWSPERQQRIGATAELFAEYGVPPEIVERWIEQERLALEAVPISEATSVERGLRDRDCVAFKDFELRVLHAPGHTEGHILLHEEESGVLFTGDHVMGCAVPYTENHILPGLSDPADPLARHPRFQGLVAYLDSIRSNRRLPVATLLPAHGGVLRQPEAYFDSARLFYDVRIQRIERGLRSLAAIGQEITAWQLWRALFPELDPVRQLKNRLLMVIGALDVLERSGSCVTRRRSGGVLVHDHVSPA